MFSFKKQSVRTAFRNIQKSPVPLAALVFPHGIELLPARVETVQQREQLDWLLQDYRKHLVGIYDASARFQNFADDVTAVKMELLLRDDFDEAVD